MTLQKFLFRFQFLFRFWFRIQTIFSTVFQQQQKKIVENLAFSCQKQHYFPENLPLIFNLLGNFFYTILSWIRIQIRNRNRNMHSGSDFVKAKSYGSCDSGSGLKVWKISGSRHEIVSGNAGKGSISWSRRWRRPGASSPPPAPAAPHPSRHPERKNPRRNLKQRQGAAEQLPFCISQICFCENKYRGPTNFVLVFVADNAFIRTALFMIKFLFLSWFSNTFEAC